jgi:hypothetical protein
MVLAIAIVRTAETQHFRDEFVYLGSSVTREKLKRGRHYATLTLWG